MRVRVSRRWCRARAEVIPDDDANTRLDSFGRRSHAAAVRRHFDPFGPWGDVTRRITVPRDVVFLNRIVIGLNSVLGMLEATFDCRAVADELREA